MNYLLDTNTVIYFFKGAGHVADNMFKHSPKEIYIPSIVLFELQVGINKSKSPEKRKEQLSTLLNQINHIDFGISEAVSAATIRATLEKRGTPIGPMDTLIAGCALANNLTLVTHNTNEFKRIDKLQLEDWF